LLEDLDSLVSIRGRFPPKAENAAHLWHTCPLNLSTLEGKCAVVAVVLMVIANCIRGRKWTLYDSA
jgi:hypothetical protein